MMRLTRTDAFRFEVDAYGKGILPRLYQLQWGGLEIAEGIRDGYLYCKHIKPFAMDLYDKYWTAFDGPPEEDT